jgi:hypothetical protein
MRGEGCNTFFFVIDKMLVWILFSLLPTTEDKKWRAAAVEFRPGRDKGAGGVKVGVWWGCK